MLMGSKTFCVINMDGSWPVMAAGCDIQSYQDCLIQFKDAWKTLEDARGNKTPANTERVAGSREDLNSARKLRS